MHTMMALPWSVTLENVLHIPCLKWFSAYAVASASIAARSASSEESGCQA